MIGDIVTREGMFETNSSSMHSITIGSKGALMHILHLDDDGITLTIDCEYDFGWGDESYTDAKAKAAYCVLDNISPNLIEIALKEQTGAKVIHYVNENNGYIDHQSVGTAQEELTSVAQVKNFIFNPNSELVISNDNK